MRIIAGKLGGRKIKSPSSRDTHTRPTLDRVRESLFNILGGTLQYNHVADICAGTGALGIEALSRGVQRASFFESYKPSQNLIRENLKDLDLTFQSQLYAGSVPKTLLNLGTVFDLVLFDPPYESELPKLVLPMLADKNMLAQNALVVVEQDKRVKQLPLPQALVVKDHRIIGDTSLWFLLKKMQ